MAEGPFKENILDMSCNESFLTTSKHRKVVTHIPGYKELDYKHDAIDALLKEVLEQQVVKTKVSQTAGSYLSTKAN